MQQSQEQYCGPLSHIIISWYKYCKWLSFSANLRLAICSEHVQAVFASVFSIGWDSGFRPKSAAKFRQSKRCKFLDVKRRAVKHELNICKQYVIELLWVIACRSWGNFCWPNSYNPFDELFRSHFWTWTEGHGTPLFSPHFNTFHVSFFGSSFVRTAFFEGFNSECIQQWLRPQIPLPCSYLWENEISMASPATVVEGGACTRFDSCVRASAMWLGMPKLFHFISWTLETFMKQRFPAVFWAGSMIYIYRIYIYIYKIW